MAQKQYTSVKLYKNIEICNIRNYISSEWSQLARRLRSVHFNYLIIFNNFADIKRLNNKKTIMKRLKSIVTVMAICL